MKIVFILAKLILEGNIMVLNSLNTYDRKDEMFL